MTASGAAAAGDDAAAETHPLRRPAMRVVLSIVCMDMLTMGLCVPVLPRLLRELVGDDMERNATSLGLFIMLWAVLQFALSPLIGALSDRFGRRPILLLSCMGTGLGYALMAWAPTIGWLFAARVVSAATSANTATANAYIADTTAPSERAASFSLVAAAYSLGFILGPALGGVLGDVDARLPFWMAAALSLVNALCGLFVLTESLPAGRRIAFSWRRANPLGSLFLLGSRTDLAWMAGAGFLVSLAEMVLPSVFVLYVVYRYGWSPSTIGLTLMAIGAVGVFFQAVLFKPGVARFGERRMLVACMLLGAAGLLAYGSASTAVWFWLSIPVVSSAGLAAPLIQAMLTRRVAPSSQGRLQGAVACLMGVAGMAGPVLFSQAFGHAIRPQASLHLPGTPFFIAALLLLAATLSAWWATRTDLTDRK